MIYLARELYPRLCFLVLVEDDETGEIEFVGDDTQWDRVEMYEALPCKLCMGTNRVEDTGDGDGFEVDLVGYKRCPNDHE